MKQEELLLSRLIEYGTSNAYPFHMPGHKRQISKKWPGQFPNPFSVDITEIEGFDNLHHAEGILRKSMDWAASVYSVDRTYYLVNGSSGGILSAVCAVTRPGGTILMSRNCHKAAYHGVVLNQLKVEYVYPQIIDGLGIQGGIPAEDVEKALEVNPEIQAVLIVSPTYDGVVSDIRRIAEVVHKRKIPLIVDEAHGAHFPFGGIDFPDSAIVCGADLVIQSLHKTLPSLTQTAVLHLCKKSRSRNSCSYEESDHGISELIDEDRLERYLQMFQSSSPSYVLMAGIEGCIYEMEQYGKQNMHEFAVRLHNMRQKLKRLKHLQLLDQDCIGTAGVYDVDLSKLVISCRNCVMTGDEEHREKPHTERQKNRNQKKNTELTGEVFSDWLRTEYQLEMEMCGADYAVAITTASDSEQGLERFTEALLAIDAWVDEGKAAVHKEGSLMDEGKSVVQNETEIWTERRPDVRMKLADAMEMERKSMKLTECAGYISAEFIYLYPPGIPIVTPGEIVTPQIIKEILRYQDMGLPVQGMRDLEAGVLQVLKMPDSDEKQSDIGR